MASKVLTTFVSMLVAVATVASVAQAAPTKTLAPWMVQAVYSREPIPSQFDPDTHPMPKNLVVRYLSHREFAAFCHGDLYGCEEGPPDHPLLTWYYIFIDAETVPPSLRPAVLRHEKAHVLGWLH